MRTLPTLDMTGWAILDYELAFDGIRHVNDATLWLQNQPRCYNTARLAYHPGADFIVQLGEDWCNDVLAGLVESLRAIRFADLKDDERRVLLLIQYEASYGPASEPLSAILAMALEQSVRPAAA